MRFLNLTLCLTLHALCSSRPLISSEKLEKMDYSDENAVTCGKGLTDCKVNSGDTYTYHDDGVYVSGLAVRALLCNNRSGLLPCLRIELNITAEGSLEASGLSSEAGTESSGPGSNWAVWVCCRGPDLYHDKKLTFALKDSEDHSTQMWMSLVLVLREADLGSIVTVVSSMNLKHNFTKHVTVPSIDTVCSQFRNIALCKVPSVSAAINHTTGMVELRLDSESSSKFHELQACRKYEKDGECSTLEWKDNAFQIPVSSVAPCSCFQVWSTLNRSSNGPRMEFCPFFNSTALPLSNVSVSVVEAQTNAEANGTALNWNITAPCKVEAELHVCKKTSETDKGCQKIKDLRNSMLQKWKIYKQYWQLQGEFAGVERHPSICVQIKVKGMDAHFVPVCPFEVTRTQWIWPVLVCLVLICLTLLGAYLIQGTLKGWILKWLKVDDISRAVGGSQVVLLYPPDVDRGLAELVCGLASSLSSLGFSVSLDMWSRSELSALGPVPWLHSRLDRVQRHGGKVVLVLNQAAWARVEEWGRRSGQGEREEHKGVNEAYAKGGVCLPAPPCSDVFSASLSCILADYLQGRAGERFVLAQFEAQPAGPPGGSGPLPELFRGLPLFSLPSQSLGFLTELTHGAHRGQVGGDSAANRRMRAGVLRAASRALASALRELTGGPGHRLAGLSNDCVHSGSHDIWESVPLQPGHSSQQVSPALPSKTNTANWV